MEERNEDIEPIVDIFDRAVTERAQGTSVCSNSAVMHVLSGTLL